MGRAIHRRVSLRRSPEYVYRLFTVGEYLETWLSVEALVEPEVGGRYELIWDPGIGSQYNTVGCRVLALEANRFLSMEWKGPPQYAAIMNEVDPLTVVTVLFLEARQGAYKVTEVHLTHTGWSTDPAWDEAYEFFGTAWEMQLKALAAVVNG